ncbi:8986_t:CDS:2 [Entrophospora sp. SA101]|nr:8986_t:CDS:2 [Entrophospora sp. SA101]
MTSTLIIINNRINEWSNTKITSIIHKQKDQRTFSSYHTKLDNDNLTDARDFESFKGLDQ